jgi:hypothetical protein
VVSVVAKLIEKSLSIADSNLKNYEFFMHIKSQFYDTFMKGKYREDTFVLKT